MAWRLADSLRVYIDQLNRLAPNRSRASDGTIGDAAHQQTSSDHNPRVIPGLGSTPVVTAADITHDPAGGMDFGRFAERLRVSQDGRIKYVIFNRRMFSWYASGGYPAWTWRPYTGSNPHTHHGHLSVVADARADSTSPWRLGSPLMAVEETIQWEIRPWTGDTLLAVQRLEQAAARDEQRDNRLQSTLDQVVTLLRGDGGSLGSASEDDADAAAGVVAQLQADLAKANQRIVELERELEGRRAAMAPAEAAANAEEAAEIARNPDGG